MSYLIGGVVPLLSNGLIEVPYAGMWLERWGLPNEDGRLGVYVGETRGVHEVAGNPTDPPTPKLMLRRRRMVLVLAHRPPYDPRQPWIGTAASSERGYMARRGCMLAS